MSRDDFMINIGAENDIIVIMLLMDDSLVWWVINWMNEWFTIIRVGEIVLSIKKILEKMKWAEEVEKEDAGLGHIQGHIRGHDLGQGHGTFQK